MFSYYFFPENVYAAVPESNSTVFMTTSASTIEIGINTYQKWIFIKSGSDWSIEGVYTWNGTSWDKSFDNSGSFILGYGSKAQSYTVLSDTSETKKIKFTGNWSNGSPQHDFEYTLECNQGDQWINLTASINFSSNTTVVDKQFGFGLYTIAGMSLDKSLIFGYEPKQAYNNGYENGNDVGDLDLRYNFPAAAAVMSGVRDVNYIMINDYNNTDPNMIRYVKKQHPESSNNIELAQYTKACTYTAGTWYSMKSKIYIDTDNNKNLNDLIGMAGDKQWSGSAFPESVLQYPLTPRVKNYQEAVNGILTELLDPRAQGYLDGVSDYKPYPFYSTSCAFSGLDVERGMLRFAKLTNNSDLLNRVTNDVLSLNNEYFIRNAHGGPAFLTWAQTNNGQLSYSDNSVNPFIGSYIHQTGQTAISTWLYYDQINSLGEIASITGNTTVRTMFLDLVTYARTLKWGGYKQALAYDADTRQPLPGDYGGAYGDGNGGGAGMWAYMMFLAYGLTNDTSYRDDGYSALATLANMDYQDYSGHYLYSPKPNVCGWVIRALVKAYELSGSTAYLDKAENVAKMLNSFTSFNSTPEFDFPTYGWMGADAHERWEAAREMAEALWIAAPLFQYRFSLTLGKIYLTMKQTFLWTLPINENPRGMYGNYFNSEDPDSVYIPFEVPMKQPDLAGMERFSKETYGAGEVFMMHQIFEAWATSDDPKILVVSPTSSRETYTNTSQKFRIYNPTADSKTFNIYFTGFAAGNYLVKENGVDKGYYNLTQITNGISFTLNSGADSLVEVSAAATAPIDITAPDSLDSVTATSNDKQQIMVSWNASVAPDFDHYIIYRSTEPETTLSKENRLYKVTGIGYLDDDKDLISGQMYYYSVVAVDHSGNSSVPVEVSAKVMWRSFAWLDTFETSLNTDDWSGVGAEVSKHKYFNYPGYTDRRFAEIIRTNTNPSSSDGTHEQPVWVDDFSTTSGWTAEDNVSFTTAGSIATLALSGEHAGGGFYGSINRTVNANLDATPYLDLNVTGVAGTGSTWTLIVNNGTESKTIATTGVTGSMQYNIKNLTGWTGEVSLSVTIYISGSADSSVSIDKIGFSKEAVVWVDDFSTTSGWTAENNVSFTTAGSIATLALSGEHTGGGFYGSIYRTVNANLDATPYLDLKVKGIAGTNSTWALVVNNGTETKIIQNNISEAGKMRYNIKDLTGWTWDVNLTIAIYINGSAGSSVSIDKIGFSKEIPVGDTNYVYKTVSNDLDQYPYIQIKVNSLQGGSKWGLLVSDGTDTFTIQPDTCQVGLLTYDIRAITSWSGNKSYDVWIKIIGTGILTGQRVSIDWIGATNGSSLLGGMSENFSDVSDWTHDSDMTMTTNGEIATVTVDDASLGYGAVYQKVACNVDEYKYLRIKVASVGKDAKWKLTVGELPDSQVMLQDATEVTGEYTYDLKALTGWNGLKEFYVYLYSLGGNGKYFKVDSIRSDFDYEYPIPHYVGKSGDTQYINMNTGTELALNKTATADNYLVGNEPSKAFDSNYSSSWAASEATSIVLSNDWSGSAGWSTDANVSYSSTDNVSTLTLNSEAFGSASKTANINIDETPYFAINPTQLGVPSAAAWAIWAITIYNGTDTITIQNNTGATVPMLYNIKNITGWSGTQNITVRLYIGGSTAGCYVKFGYAGFMDKLTSPADDYPHWLKVDLGRNYKVFDVDIRFGDHYAQNYILQVSTDASTWTDVVNVIANRTAMWASGDVPPLKTINHTFIPITARYVRLYATTGNSTDLIIAEMQVHGLSDITLGSISGTVKDSSNNPISEANVSLEVDEDVYYVQTNQQGIYMLLNVPAGEGYSVTAGKTGYNNGTAANFNVIAGSTTSNVNITLAADTSDGNTPDSNTPGSGGNDGDAALPLNELENVVDSNGNVSITASSKLDSSTGIAAVAVNSDTLTSAFNREKTDKDGMKIVELNIPKVDGAKAYELILPGVFLTSGDGTKAVEIKTGSAVVLVPGNMLASSDAVRADTVSLTIAAGDKTKLDTKVQTQIGDRPVIELTFKIDGKQISWSNDNSPVIISIPYTPTEDELENPEQITVWYIDDSGNAVSVPNGRYSAATGMVTFSTTHFSKYAIAFVQKTFSDITAYNWARHQIEVLASKGIINGTSKDDFSPAANITKADYLVLLVKTLGLSADFDSNFSDVEPGSYYYKAVGIAKKLGIAAGSGNNRFNPKENITRQDMMVLTSRSLKKFKKLKIAESNTVLDKFKDRTDIASYAMESLATLVREDLITGSGDTMKPHAKTTRAEAAVLLYRIYNKYPG